MSDPRDQRPSESDLGRAAHRLMSEGHTAASHDLPELMQRHVTGFGATRAAAYLVDLQQLLLIPFLGPGGPTVTDYVEALAVDATLAGRAYQHVTIVEQSSPTEHVLWFPMLNGTERLGVMALTVATSADVGESQMRALQLFVALMSELVMTKTMYGDYIVNLRRAARMGLAAELQWSLLPPLTFACSEVTVAAALEPAYDVGGDTFDYAVDPGTARIAVFDGMGHGLQSAQIAAMAISAYRHARRAGSGVIDASDEIDLALQQTFSGTVFTTALLAELDTASGQFVWTSAGHPPPLLIRHGRLVKTLESHPRPPLGLDLAGMEHLSAAHLSHEQLEPGDSVLLYTDGVTEARSPDGEFFGSQRLVDLVIRNLAAGLPAPETMRRVVHALLEHQQGQLRDDATLVFLQWRTTPQQWPNRV